MRKGQPKGILKPFKKNDPRINKKGRPPILPELRDALKKVLSEEKDGIIALNVVLMSLRNKAIKGDVRAIQEILDRYYGKVKQDIGITGPPESNLTRKERKLRIAILEKKLDDRRRSNRT